MRLPALVLLLCGLGVAQTPAPPATAAVPATAPASSTSAGIGPELDSLQTSATQTAGVLGRLRIEKWKADGDSKRQAQSNADSIQRNLTSALPAMIANVRSNPQDMSAQFKLYRNLNALYDVLTSVTESAGAFGPKNDYEALASQLAQFDTARRAVGDSVEQLAASTQAQLNQLRSQVQTLEQRTAAAATPPKKVVVDENEPAKKATTTKKKKSTKPATPATTTAGDTSSQH